MPPAAKRSKPLPATWVLRTLASSWTDVPGIPGRGTGLPGGPAAFTGGSLGPLRRCRGWGDRALVWQVDGRLPTSPRPLPGRGGMSEAGEESEHLLEFSCIRRRNFPSSKGGLDLPQRGLLCAGGGGPLRGCSAHGFRASFPEMPGFLCGGGEGSGAWRDCTGFPVGTMPRVGGRPQVRGSGFPEDGPGPPRALPAPLRQEVRGPGPPAPDPRGADGPGGTAHKTLGTWFYSGAHLGPRL